MTEPYELPQLQYQSLVFSMLCDLHNRGHGLLKMAAYTKEGLGAWRHLIFASTSFPDTRTHRDIPDPKLFGSYRDIPLAKSANPAMAADMLLQQHPDLAAASIGRDDRYTRWMSSLRSISQAGVFEMEDASTATLGSVRIFTPYNIFD